MSPRIILLLVLGAPLAEILSIIAMTSLLGWLLTIALLGLGGVIGMSLLRRSGREVLSAWRQRADRDRLPQGVTQGLSRYMLAGILLIIPGFLSDVLALLLLVGGGRSLMAARRRRAPSDKTIDLDSASYRRINEGADSKN